MTVLGILVFWQGKLRDFLEFLAYQHCAMPITLKGKATCQRTTKIQILRPGYAG